MDWLRTPACVVSAHLRMIPVLDAEDALGGVSVHAVGSALESGPWVGDQMSSWCRAAKRHSPRRVATPADLAASGVKMKVVERGR